MERVNAHTGRAVALRRNDVDTDQIIPAEFCKRLTKSGYADALFGHWRREPDFVLNQKAHACASVLVAAHNFGTGSSREHAVWALHDWGFRAVIAASFGDIFFRNALKNGLLPVVLPADVIDELTEWTVASADFEITIDLGRLEVSAAGLSWPFEVDHQARWLLLNGLDDIDVTLTKDTAITVYEERRMPWLPTMRPGSFGGAQPMTLEQV